MAKKPTLEAVEASLARWKTRLKRAMTAIDKLEKQRKRLVAKAAFERIIPPPGFMELAGAGIERPVDKPVDNSAAVAERVSVPAYPTVDSESAHAAPDPKVSTPGALPPVTVTPGPAPVKDDLGIPDFLRRQGPSPEAEQIKAEQAAIKKAKAQGRIAKMKAKKSGELKKMPLSGRAALDAIKNG